MHIALISDIHGNLVSLEAVLADIHRERVDQIICLGDVAVLGPQPCEVIARLKALGCPCVMGNHDSDVLNLDLVHDDTLGPPWVVEMIDWCTGQLSEADCDYLRSFQPLIQVPLDDTTRATLLCFHGSPRSNKDFILATTPPAELEKMLAGHKAMVMAGGHAHAQMLRQHKGVMIMNVGSVGWPVELPFKDTLSYLPWAEYAIVNWVDGVLDIEFRRVPIDLDAVKQAALTSDIPGAARWVEQWITLEDSQKRLRAE